MVTPKPATQYISTIAAMSIGPTARPQSSATAAAKPTNGPTTDRNIVTRCASGMAWSWPVSA